MKEMTETHRFYLGLTSIFCMFFIKPSVDIFRPNCYTLPIVVLTIKGNVRQGLKRAKNPIFL